MTGKDAYDTLMDKLGFSGSTRLRSILEMLTTPEQAQLTAALPGNVAEVAERTGIPIDKARAGLDELFHKGVVFPKGDFVNRDHYRFARSIVQLHDSSQATGQLSVTGDSAYFRAWHDFCLEEMYPQWAAIFSSLPSPPLRIVPAYKSIENLPDILPCENFPELLKAQHLIAVVPCSCRYRTTSVGEQCGCHAETEAWVCLQFARGAEYVIERGSGRKLAIEEALELNDTIEENGLLHIWNNNTLMTRCNTSCQCCRDCCENYVAADQVGADIGKIWQKSRYEAYVADTDACTGCEDCAGRCAFDAIEMVGVDNGDDVTSSVLPEHCFGCGVCVVRCPSGAMEMRVVRPPEFIPEPAG